MQKKVAMPKRGNSNPPLKGLPPSAVLEEQTKKMEQRLKELKDVMADQAAKREALGSGSGSRWQSANTEMPIKNYAKTVLDSKPSIPAKTGKEIPRGTVVKPSRDRPTREKVPPLSGPTVTTPGSTSNISQKNKENESQKDFFKGAVTATPTSVPSVTSSATKTATRQQKPVTTQQEEEKTAENNINRALNKQKETNEVEKFLEEIGLPQYAERFKENGFDDLETLMDAQTKHFVDMKIPAGHQIKLSKRIEQLKQNTRPAEQTTLPTQKPDAKPANQINMEQLKTNSVAPKRTEYVQLAEPTREMAIGDDRPQGGELLQGAYNEAESHKSFQDALNEWRSGKPAAVQQPGSARGNLRSRQKESREKKVRFAEPTNEKGKDDSDETDYISTKATKKEAPKVDKDDKKSFFFSGGASWNQVEVPGQKETSTNMSPREGQASQKAKVSCWHCYKLVGDDEVKLCVKKQFCSDECVKNYRDMNSTKCIKNTCNNKFLKEEGIMREGRWYCSEKCAPTAEEILMEEQRLLKRIEKEQGKPGSKGSDRVDSSRESQRSGQEESGENNSAEDERPVEIDLSVDVSNKKQVLTLAELEEKYKNLSQLAEKAEGGENEFEDSLN